MTVVAFVPEPEVANAVVDWARGIAEPLGEPLEILCWEARSGTRTQEAVRDTLGDLEVPLEGLHEPEPVASVVAYCRRRQATTLVTCKFDLPGHGGTQTSELLMRTAHCNTFLVLYGERTADDIRRALLLLSGTAHDRTLLQFARIADERKDTRLTLAKIEVDIGEGAEAAGRRDLEWAIHDVGIEEGEDVELKVVVDNHPIRGLLRNFENHDLVLVGEPDVALLKPLEQALGGATAAVVRRAPPLSRRALPDWIPRINPADYAELVQQLRQGSRWQADFIVMLGLAAAIATLGLLQNSPAVVIGSMLLAPLMTPMIGLGLALKQANRELLRTCMRSIVLGVALTIGVSMALGLLMPSGESLTTEIQARGNPNILDLLIALFAAVAASFALARPGIAGAVAGVAIATALVPPACSIGISVAYMEWLNALGASALFLTNLLAIVLASSATFALMGVTAERALPRQRRYARRFTLAVAVILVGLAIPLGKALGSRIQEGRTMPLAYPVTQALARAVTERIEEEPGAELMLIGRSSTARRVAIYLAATEDVDRALESELTEIVRRSMNDDDMPVKIIVVRLGWRD